MTKIPVPDLLQHDVLQTMIRKTTKKKSANFVKACTKIKAKIFKKLQKRPTTTRAPALILTPVTHLFFLLVLQILLSKKKQQIKLICS